jgi:V/A-type H+-transporting ATPase subunit K
MVNAVSNRALAALLLAFAAMLAFAPQAQAAAGPEEDAEAAATEASWATAVRDVGIALAAALAIGIAAWGTAKVQAAVGSGGTGALAENRELFVPILTLIALPETIVVLGFVLGFLLWLRVGG